jgi:hypothetical protein
MTMAAALPDAPLRERTGLALEACEARGLAPDGMIGRVAGIVPRQWLPGGLRQPGLAPGMARAACP